MDGNDLEEDHETMSLEGDSISKQLRHICLEYSYKQLQDATENFSKSRQLGEGSAGTVFKAEMQDGSYAAVKVIDLSTIGDMVSVAGFEDEIAILSKFRHPNLVVLMGWAKEGSRRFLVYEYLSSGDISGRLQKSRSGPRPWMWHERISVLRDAAQGLAHLHNAKPHAFHRDVKSANILLNGEVGAKVADFGLACVAKQSKSSTVKCKFPSGTPGYTCPTYASSGKMTEGAEAFSFGVVILEVLLNMMPAGMLNGELIFPLADAVQPCHPGAVDRCVGMADPSAGWPPPVAAEIAALGMACIDQNQAQRPTFNDVCKRLRGLQAQYPPIPVGGPPPSGALGGPQPWHHPHMGHAAPLPPPGAPFHTMGPPSNPHLPGYPPPPPGMLWQGPPPGGPFPSGVLMMHGPPPGHPPPQTRGPMPPPTAAPPAPAPHAGQMPPEVALEVTHLRIGSVSNINPSCRVLPFAPHVDRDGRKIVPLGRQHQPQWFEAILQDAGDLSCISRTVAEFVWAGPDPNTRDLRMRVVSKHPILVDDVAVPSGEWAPIFPGSRVALTGQVETGGRLVLLVFVVHCSASARAPAQQPRGSGQRLPAPMPHPQAQCFGQQMAVPVQQVAGRSASAPPAGLPQASWRLDCAHATGLSEQEFYQLPAAVRSMTFELTMDCPYMVLGRNYQRDLFEALLANDKHALTYISRSHFKFEFIEGQEPPELGHIVSVLQVTNMSPNVAAIAGHILRQGETTIARDGDTIGFLTPPPMPDSAQDLEVSPDGEASRTHAAARGSGQFPSDDMDALELSPQHGAEFLTLRLVGPPSMPSRGELPSSMMPSNGSPVDAKDRRLSEPPQARPPAELPRVSSELVRPPVPAKTAPPQPTDGGKVRSNGLSRPQTQGGGRGKEKDKGKDSNCALM
mmetsp:Transcript_54994/g.128608  ORF Transcript_54994/g.128608 Transcript_54994/m.128608 type:complete len:905 (+) Transcript_54994:87-2801(+)